MSNKKKKAKKRKKTVEKVSKGINMVYLKKFFIAVAIAVPMLIITVLGYNTYKARIANGYFKISKEEFENVASAGSNLIMFQQNDKWGIMDKRGHIIVKPQFERILPECERLLPVKREGKWGFININGKEVVDCKYQNVTSFTKGIAAVCYGGKWGIIDNTGRYLVKPQYQDIIIHTNKTIAAKKNNKWGIISLENKVLVPFDYDDVQVLEDEETFLVKNKKGYKVVKPRSTKNEKMFENFYFSDFRINVKNCLPIMIDGKWGILDIQTFQQRVPASYEDAWSHKEGWIELKKGNRTYIYFKTGRFLTQSFDRNAVMLSSDNLICVKDVDGFIYFININKEKIVNRVKGDEITQFNAGYAAVKVGQKWGVVNQKGEFVIKPVYDAIWLGEKNYMIVQKNKKWGLLNLNGDILLPIRYDLIGEVKSGLVAFQLNGNWGVADLNTKELVSAKYNEIIIHSNNIIFARRDVKWFILLRKGYKVLSYSLNTSTISKINDSVYGIITPNNKYRLLFLLK